MPSPLEHQLPTPASVVTHLGSIKPLLVRINDAAAMLGVSRSSIYNLAKEKRLRIVSIAGRSLVVADDIHGLVREACA